MVTDRLPADRGGCDLDILLSTESKCGLANGISLVSFTVSGTCHPFKIFFTVTGTCYPFTMFFTVTGTCYPFTLFFTITGTCYPFTMFFTVTGTYHPFTMFTVCGMYTQVLERYVDSSLVF